VSPTLGLSSVAVTKYTAEQLTTGTIVKTYSFDNSAENWTFSGRVLPFSEALRNSGFSGLLDLISTTNTNTFGFWASPTTDITLEDSKLYKVQFTLGTDVTNPAQVPTVRLRAYNATNQVAHCLVKPAIAQISSSDYVVLFDPPPALAGQGLGIAFDILNFDPNADPRARLSLDSVTITSHETVFP
jgi:hypothetical protein